MVNSLFGCSILAKNHRQSEVAFQYVDGVKDVESRCMPPTLRNHESVANKAFPR
jgi:hypothetical protein